MKSRTAIIVLLTLSTVALPSVVVAQSAEEQEGATKWRRWVGAA